MKTLPVVGKQYTDRDGVTVVVTRIVKSGGGNTTAMRRNTKKTGYTITISNGKFESTLGLEAFTRIRRFTEDATD